MQIRLIAVDKLRSRAVADTCAEFRKRLGPYFRYEETEIRASHGGDPATAMREEGDRIMKLLRPDERLWLLDRDGAELTSIEFAERMQRCADEGLSRLTFVVAGTYGADPALRARAAFVWSLSRLTFLHEWARMIVLEQLYRAAKIANNEPYHH